MLHRTLLALAALAAFAVVVPTEAASAASGPAIAPGVQMVTAGRVCTAGFVFRDARGRRYVAYAAHCASRGAASAADGCSTPSRALGTRVRFAVGATAHQRGRTLGWGTLRYSSWTAMKRAGVKDPATCRTNDLALVRVDRAYRRRVDPTVPFWGGPTALGQVPAAGSRIFTLGMVSPRDRSASPKSGDVATASSQWARISMPLPSTALDAGAGFLDSRGRAFGVLSALDGASGTSGVGALAPQVAFARSHGMRGLTLVPGREPFHPVATW